MSTPTRRFCSEGPPVSAKAKARRVRTGCLTCRERHLKCDESTPDCQNCRKSNRTCKRGIRLNFLDITVHEPREVPPIESWKVSIQDESLHVASEYKGGRMRYELPGTKPHTRRAFRPEGGCPATRTVVESSPTQPSGRVEGAWPAATQVPGHRITSSKRSPLDAGANKTEKRNEEQLPYDSGCWPWWSPSDDFDLTLALVAGARELAREQSSTASIAPQATHAPSQNGSPVCPDSRAKLPVTPPEDRETCSKNTPREYLDNTEDVEYMEVFVNEVATWMDCFNRDQHFGSNVPFQALKTPMLRNSLLACGGLRLSFRELDHRQTASMYYNTATSQLLRNLQNPERNTAECATAAVVLNIYEAMTHQPAHRMSHVAGARALIKECGWNAKSSGVGAACFWLSVGMEVLDCLATRQPTTWDPDDWGVHMDFSGDPDNNGMDQGDIWVHRMFYIVANVANFRACSPSYETMSPHRAQMERSSRLCEWQRIKRLCDKWNDGCPRSMHPLGYLDPSESRSNSCFPEIWLIRRPALLGRLLYHTGQCLLAQTNPLEQVGSSNEMMMLQLHHAHQICGIVAHNRDQSMWTVAARAIEIAAPSLVEAPEQEESLCILDSTNTRGSQWLRDVVCKLRGGWDQQRARTQLLQSPVSESNTLESGKVPSRRDQMTTDPGLTPPMRSRALSNESTMCEPRSLELEPSPLMSRNQTEALRSADFSCHDRPYKNWWQPASQTTSVPVMHFPEAMSGLVEPEPSARSGIRRSNIRQLKTAS